MNCKVELNIDSNLLTRVTMLTDYMGSSVEKYIISLLEVTVPEDYDSIVNMVEEYKNE